MRMPRYALSSPRPEQRRNRRLLGWHVAQTEGVDDVAYLLSVTRGELNPAAADDDR
jgi:hypothetical protein